MEERATSTGLHDAYALVVGIAAYRNVPQLPASVTEDARAVARVLADPHRGAYPPEHVRLRLDDEADGATLRDDLAWLATSTGRDSVAFVFASAHGAALASGDTIVECVLPVDVDPDDPATLATVAIDSDTFSEALAAIPARKKVVVLDACHAAGIGAPKTLDRVLRKGLSGAYLQRLAEGTGTVIFASSRADEQSWVLDGDTNSVFTKHLLSGIDGGAASEDGLVRVFDLFEFLQPRVTREVPHQHPVFKAEVESNFAVALRQGGVAAASSPADDFRHDAFVSFADAEPDVTFVHEVLLPALVRAGVRVVVAADVDQPGVARVVNLERGMRHARRTVVVLSDAYLRDRMARFENVLSQSMGIEEGHWRVVPVRFALVSEPVPLRLSMLSQIDLTQPERREKRLEQLVRGLLASPSSL